MRSFIFLLFIGILISFSSCRKDFSTVSSSGNLEFSAKKVYLDTVFSNIGSSTYSLKVYNRSNKDISIPSIQLGKGLVSKYRLMVDGMTGNQGKIFNNVELLAKDSLFIFIETTVDIANATSTDFTYNDQILFDVGSNQQSVDLITLIQDAKFYFPTRSLNPTLYETIAVNGFDPDTRGHTLVSSDFDTAHPWSWTKDKPVVIYGNLLVPTGTTLTVGAGTSVYFHKDATLIVQEGAKIDIQGQVNTFKTDGTIDQKNEVTFEGDRLEPDFEDVPGQWGAVIILSDLDNSINHLTLKNAVVGIYTVSNTVIPKLTAKNTQLYGCSNYGILAVKSNVSGKNIVISDSGQASLACTFGGFYDFVHCTFNNNWASSNQKAVYISNFYKDSNNNIFVADLQNANFKNCIIYGSNNVELLLDKIDNPSSTTVFNYAFDHCLIKFNENGTLLSGNPLYNFIAVPTQATTLGNIKSLEPKFKNINKNQYKLLVNSPAIGTADYLNFSDILENPRTPPSDIGAYKFIP